MKLLFASLLLLTSIPALAQNVDDLYRQACGPKDTAFQVDHVQHPPAASPEPGKALVYFIQKESSRGIVTRVGLDGTWGGVILDNSYIPVSVSPGEHHLCAATQNRQNPDPVFAHFTAESGHVYYFLVRVTAADIGSTFTMELAPADRDEATYRIASEPRSVSKPKP